MRNKEYPEGDLEDGLNRVALKVVFVVASFILMSLLVGCGSSGSGGSGGDVNPATGYCTSGAMALQLNSGDIAKARPVFNSLVANPDISPRDTPGHVLDVLRATNKRHTRHYIDQAHSDMLEGWQVSMLITTEFGHWIYLKALYQTDTTGKRWHAECIQTSLHNFGQRVGVNIEIVTDRNGVEIEKIVSGPYAGLEVSEYFILKP